MDVVTPFIPDPQAAVLVQPGERPLDDPAEDAQPASVWRSPLGKMRVDAS